MLIFAINDRQRLVFGFKNNLGLCVDYVWRLQMHVQLCLKTICDVNDIRYF